MAAKPEIVYVFDGYCGWCWGIEATVQKLAAEFADRFQFSALSGGLITGGRIGPLGDFSDYIERAIPRVEQMTGTQFTDAYKARIRDRSTMQNSLVPAAAFALVTETNAEVDTMQLADEILRLNFVSGLDLSLPKTYEDLFRVHGLSPKEALDRLGESQLAALAEPQFTRAREMGAEAFPTIVYGREGTYFPLCQGYQSYENLSHALDILHREPPPI